MDSESWITMDTNQTICVQTPQFKNGRWRKCLSMIFIPIQRELKLNKGSAPPRALCLHLHLPVCWSGVQEVEGERIEGETLLLWRFSHSCWLWDFALANVLSYSSRLLPFPFSLKHQLCRVMSLKNRLNWHFIWLPCVFLTSCSRWMFLLGGVRHIQPLGVISIKETM